MINADDYSLVTQHLVMTEHLNPNHHIFGGQLLAWLDKDLYIYIANKLRHKNFVTLGMNNVRFRNPANLGEIIKIFARVKEVKRTSVITEGKAIAYDPENQSMRDVIECEITYVALGSDKRPQKIITDANLFKL